MSKNVEEKAVKSPKRVFWELLLIGFALIAGGVFVLVNPQDTLKFVLISLGVVSLISSVGFLIRFMRIRVESGWTSAFILVLAILLLIFGLTLVLKPDATWRFLMYLVGMWFIAYAVFSLATSAGIRRYHSKLFTITFILGLLLLIVGVLLIMSPTIGITFIGLLIGLALLFNGIEFILLAIAGKAMLA